MDAESIGLNENSIVLGKHSGRAAFRARLIELGYTISDDELNRAFARFKVYCTIYDKYIFTQPFSSYILFKYLV